MAGYFTYYIDVWDEHLQQLHSTGTFKTKQAARSAAVEQLEQSRLPYKWADVNIMHSTERTTTTATNRRSQSGQRGKSAKNNY